ncbi:MAG: hypothetical protein ACO1O3_16230 [Sphingobium sp.]
MLAAAAEGRQSDPLTEDDRASIRKEVEAQLLFPATARYRWPATRKWGLYCGWVSGQNRAGVYIAFRPFFVIGGRGATGPYKIINTLVANGDPKGLNSRVVEDMCREQGFDMSGPPSSHPMRLHEAPQPWQIAGAIRAIG